MIGLIIAISIIGTGLATAITLGVIKLHKMEKNMTTLAECLLTYMTHPEQVDIVENYSVNDGTNFNFPNSTGF